MDKVKDLKEYFLSFHPQGIDGPWCEGYCKALLDEDAISEDDYEAITDWLANQ